ncbi:hypothetical protein GCM10025734_06940 [Kitasatospora paranensis]|uniref:WXG100 family type VII secretion target n=1 Tax=Kitasatospora paranensis TaxID=258053 RepID=UPI0031EF1D74
MAVELPEPLQWVLLLLAGCRWPEADEDQLRDMAAHCRKAAEDLKDAAQGSDAAIKRALDGQQGMAAEALTTYWAKFATGKGTQEDPGYLPGAVNALDGMGDMLEQMANSAETAKIQIIAQLGILAFEIATAEAEAPFTAGASLLEVPVMIGASRAVVSTLLKTLLKEMITMAAKQAAQMAAINLLAQGIEVAEGHRKSIDMNELGQNALGGAIGGASGHLIGRGIGGAGKKLGAESALNSTAGKMATGAVVGVGADVSTQLITTGKVDGESLLGSGLSGGAGAGLHAGAAAIKGHANAPKPAEAPHLDLPNAAAHGGQHGPPTFSKPTASSGGGSYHGPTDEAGGGTATRSLDGVNGASSLDGGNASGTDTAEGPGPVPGSVPGVGGSRVSGLMPFGSARAAEVSSSVGPTGGGSHPEAATHEAQTSSSGGGTRSFDPPAQRPDTAPAGSQEPTLRRESESTSHQEPDAHDPVALRDGQEPLPRHGRPSQESTVGQETDSRRRIPEQTSEQMSDPISERGGHQDAQRQEPPVESGGPRSGAPVHGQSAATDSAAGQGVAPVRETVAEPSGVAAQRSGTGAAPDLSGVLGGAAHLPAAGGSTNLDGGTRISGGHAPTRTDPEQVVPVQTVPDASVSSAAQSPTAGPPVGGGFLPGPVGSGGTTGHQGGGSRSGSGVPSVPPAPRPPVAQPITSTGSSGTVRPGAGRTGADRLPPPPPPTTRTATGNPVHGSQGGPAGGATRSTPSTTGHDEVLARQKQERDAELRALSGRSSVRDAVDRLGREQRPVSRPPADADRLRRELPTMSPQERAQELAAMAPEDRRWLARDPQTVDALKNGLPPKEFARTAAELIVHVDPRAERAASARQEAQRQVARMLQDPETAARLLKSGADVVVVPKDVRMPDVPELHNLRGVHNSSSAGAGRGYDDMRGSGGRHSAVTEENLLGEHTPIGHGGHYEDGYSTTTHEFTHTVHRYGLDATEQKLITDTFRQKLGDPKAAWPDGPRHDSSGKPVDNYSSRDEQEYFAQLTNAYLGTNHGTDPYTGRPRNNGADWVRRNEPAMLPLLEKLYGRDPGTVHDGQANPVHATTADNRMYEGFREFMEGVDGTGSNAPGHRPPTAPPPAPPAGRNHGPQADAAGPGGGSSHLPPPPPKAPGDREAATDVGFPPPGARVEVAGDGLCLLHSVAVSAPDLVGVRTGSPGGVARRLQSVVEDHFAELPPEHWPAEVVSNYRGHLLARQDLGANVLLDHLPADVREGYAGLPLAELRQIVGDHLTRSAPPPSPREREALLRTVRDWESRWLTTEGRCCPRQRRTHWACGCGWSATTAPPGGLRTLGRAAGDGVSPGQPLRRQRTGALRDGGYPHPRHRAGGCEGSRPGEGPGPGEAPGPGEGARRRGACCGGACCGGDRREAGGAARGRAAAAAAAHGHGARAAAAAHVRGARAAAAGTAPGCRRPPADRGYRPRGRSDRERGGCPGEGHRRPRRSGAGRPRGGPGLRRRPLRPGHPAPDAQCALPRRGVDGPVRRKRLERHHQAARPGHRVDAPAHREDRVRERRRPDGDGRDRPRRPMAVQRRGPGPAVGRHRGAGGARRLLPRPRPRAGRPRPRRDGRAVQDRRARRRVRVEDATGARLRRPAPRGRPGAHRIRRSHRGGGPRPDRRRPGPS